MRTHFALSKLVCVGLLSVAIHASGQAEGLLAVTNPAELNPQDGPYGTLEMFQANDALAMRSYLSDWRGAYHPHSGVNIGMAFGHAELGYQWQGWRLGGLYRAQAWVETNRDTTDLVRQYNTNAGYETGRAYGLDYQLAGFTASGVRLSKGFPLQLASDWEMRWGVGAALLKGEQLKLENASGQVVALNAKDFNANASLATRSSALNTKDPSQFSPFVTSTSPFSGDGYALDAGVVMRRSDGLRIELAANDLVGQMEWKSIPQQLSQYNTATKVFDAAGYVRFNPTATSQSSFVDYSQVLEPRWWLAASVPWNGFEMQLASSVYRNTWLPELRASTALSARWRLQTGYDLRFGTLLLALKHPWFELALRTDDPDLAQAKGYGVNMVFAMPL